jgi:exodeoxyribonuclease VII large subunit
MTQSEFFFNSKEKTKKKKVRKKSIAPTEAKPNSAATPIPNQPFAPTEKSIYSITQITRLIKGAILDQFPGTVTIKGEISNFKAHYNGHVYLALKDAGATIPAVIWKGTASKLKITPADGMQVTATGNIDLYEAHGKYQFIIRTINDSGTGALEMAYKALLEKLKSEGLFKTQYKKPIPPIPETIAIVSSASGAAIEDIKNTLNRRFPIVKQWLYTVAVQGKTAGDQIANAIRNINTQMESLGHVDLIIIARGGGSIEDLWAFNEEVVARAIFESTIPIICGVGHETDTTIADFVADFRAPTPTAAAEIAVPDINDITASVNDAYARLTNTIGRQLVTLKQQLNSIASRPCFNRPLDTVNYKLQTVDQKESQLTKSVSEIINQSKQSVFRCEKIIDKIEPRRHIVTKQNALNNLTNTLTTILKNQMVSQQFKVREVAIKLSANKPDTTTAKHQLHQVAKRLENLNPKAVLNRGYSITRNKQDHNIITDTTSLQDGAIIVTELANNMTVESKVTQKAKKET